MFNTLSNLRILKIVLSTRTFENNENDLLEAKKLFPRVMCIAKKKVGDVVWNTYSTDQKTQHTHFELSNLVQK